MKRGNWRLWIALLAAIIFVGLVLDARRNPWIGDRVDDNRVFTHWLKTIQRK